MHQANVRRSLTCVALVSLLVLPAGARAQVDFFWNGQGQPAGTTTLPPATGGGGTWDATAINWVTPTANGTTRAVLCIGRLAFKFARSPQGTFTHAALADYDGDGRLDIYFCMYMYYLGLDNWIRLVVWLALGLVIYFGYGRYHTESKRADSMEA